MPEKEKEIKKEGYKITEVPTQMGLVIATPEGEHISDAELLVRIANEISEIKKGLVG